MSGHTPTPWRYLPNRNIVDRRGYFVANVQLGISSTNFSEMGANAALIVKAVNSRPDLMKALEAAEAAYQALIGRSGYDVYQALEDTATKLRQDALAKAVV